MKYKEPIQHNNSIISAIQCLRLLTDAQHALSVKEVSELLNKNYTHAHRVLSTLFRTGLLGKTMENKYIIGQGLYILAAQALQNSGLITKSVEVLKSYVREGVFIAVGILFYNKVWYFIHTKPGGTIDSTVQQDMLTYDADKSMIAICLSAFMQENMLIDFFKTNTIKKFHKDIRLKGYFYHITQEGHNTISFPIIALKNTLTNFQISDIKKYISKSTPVAGLAFIDTKGVLQEKKMLDIYTPAAVELCKALY